MSHQYAVMGNPIKHSLSPQIHSLFAQQTQQDMSYEALLVQENDFEKTVERFFANSGKGLNITLPFKLRAWEMADESTSRADFAQAANTLTLLDDGRIQADNTDGAGLLADLTNQYTQLLEGRRILVIGAGGAVRGVLANLLDEKPSELVITNRTLSTAEQLAQHFSSQGNIVVAQIKDTQGPFDLIINGTSASLMQRLPEVHGKLINSHTLVYDMVYGNEPTVFMRWGLEQGAHQVADGLGMLIEQAAEAFKLWRNQEPNTAKVVDVIRAQISSS